MNKATLVQLLSIHVRIGALWGISLLIKHAALHYYRPAIAQSQDSFSRLF